MGFVKNSIRKMVLIKEALEEDILTNIHNKSVKQTTEEFGLNT
jgi:hypothetical protein